MSQNVNPTFIKTPNRGVSKISTGTGAFNVVTVYTGGANGSKVNALVATAVATTAAFDVTWGINTATGAFYLGTSSVPATAGTVSGIPSVNLMSNSNVPLALDSDGNPFLILATSADSLVAYSAALSSAWVTNAVINVIAPSVGDF